MVHPCAPSEAATVDHSQAAAEGAATAVPVSMGTDAARRRCGRDDATVMAHTIAQFPGDASHHIERFLEVAAPWMTRQDVAAVLATVLAKPLRFRADTLGARLGLREVERSRLRIRTIGAIDLTKAERLARRRDRKRVRRIGCRRAQGIRPRAVYEATSASRTKPWQAQGISRRTWERRGRPRLTQV